ncbi:MAG: M24 family metallopeptidase [Candidatus Moraniibacteriota bacterium]
MHGIGREERLLQEGDLLKLDIGMRFRGMVSDMARTVAVGSVSKEAEKLMKTTEAALLAGIETMRPGSTLAAYAQAVEGTVKQAGFSVVRDPRRSQRRQGTP